MSDLGTAAPSPVFGQTTNDKALVSSSGPSVNTTPEYLMSITGGKLGKNNYIVGYLPESFTMTSRSNFESPLASGFGSIVGNTVQTVSALTGVSTVTKSMTFQNWQNTEPITFQFPLLLNAYKDPVLEVLIPLVQLLCIPLPTLQGQDTISGLEQAAGKLLANIPGLSNNLLVNVVDGLLVSPSGTFTDVNNLYTVRIGNIAIFPGMIISDTTVDFDSLVTSNGSLITAKVDITVISATIMTAQDMVNSFFLKSNSGPQ